VTDHATAPSLVIGRYERRAAQVHDWDPRALDVARLVTGLVRDRDPDLVVEHIGSTAVPDLPGKGIVDLSVQVEPREIPRITRLLYDLGFQAQPGPDPWPPTRPMLVGAVELDRTEFRIHFHVQPIGGDMPRDLAFRDALRAEPRLTQEYAALKRAITHGDAVDAYRYTHSKTAWILGVYRSLGYVPASIDPPATIGILGGGQLGRMLAIAARQLGYRVTVLDPDPTCPAAGVADRVEVGAYDDVEAARRLASVSDVVTFELEHVSLDMLKSLDGTKPVRPGPYPLSVTQDRLAERRFVEANGGEVAAWREVASADGLGDAVRELGLPLRVKTARGGYDGRGQWRLASERDVRDGDAARAAETVPHVAERELAFEMELSVLVARAADGTITTYPVARNVHDEGILVESVAPAPIADDVASRARELATGLATGMNIVGVLTVELFLMPDGSLVVNELAPRVHNSGHWTIEGAETSQFEQHVRAICGLPLGSTALRRPAAATVNVLGTGHRRPARIEGLREALGSGDLHLHLYDKREVFERRKMGHLTALAEDTETALELARAARAHLVWT
jgi:5-(carboxyamino)imidazole ribonucleotide synthase